MRFWTRGTASSVLFMLVLCLSFAGCAIQLAPPYDKAVVDGLNAANAETMTLLAEVSHGTKSDTFPKREEKYNTLIGKLEALAVSAGARPMPSNKVTETINKQLEKRGTLQDFQDDETTPPSAHAIRKIAQSLEKMRDQDMKAGLKSGDVKAFKGQIAIYFDQAITYENFLKR
jgi:hypothetical protein